MKASDVMGMRISEEEKSPLMFDQEGKLNKPKPKIGMEEVMRGALGVPGGQERPEIDWKEVMGIDGTRSKSRISAEEVLGADLSMPGGMSRPAASGNFMGDMLSRSGSLGNPEKGMAEAMGLKPFIKDEPVMGAARDPSLPAMGKKPGMSMAEVMGGSDPAGYDAKRDTYTPDFVRDAVEQSRLKAELPYQLDSAVANRMPTPEARAAMMADLSKQRLVADAAKPKGDDWAPMGGGSAINRKTGERSDAPAKVKDESLYAWREGMPPRILIDEGTVGVVNPRTKHYELNPLKRQKVWGVDPATGKRGERMESNYDTEGLVLYDKWKPEGAAAPAVGELSAKDQGALGWAQANPKDPRAAKILERLGVR